MSTDDKKFDIFPLTDICTHHNTQHNQTNNNSKTKLERGVYWVEKETLLERDEDEVGFVRFTLGFL